jgi:hypothetical protein
MCSAMLWEREAINRLPRKRAVKQLHARGVTDEEIRRLFEAALAGTVPKGGSRV